MTTQASDDRVAGQQRGVLSFRSANPGDWALLFRAYQHAQNNPFVTSFAETTMHLPAASLEAYCCRNDRALWVIQQGAMLAGFVLLLDIDIANRSAQVDIGFVETPFAPASQGAAALDKALRQTSAKHGLTRLQIAVLVDDAAKLALIESLDFKKEGVLREQFFWQGAQRDLVCLARLER